MRKMPTDKVLNKDKVALKNAQRSDSNLEELLTKAYENPEKYANEALLAVLEEIIIKVKRLAESDLPSEEVFYKIETLAEAFANFYKEIEPYLSKETIEKAIKEAESLGSSAREKKF
ncbi:MAG: hypothetical protein ACP5JU_04115 [Minisyncoccia bacterium]